MTLPTLPTDNLYKFNFLAGITIVITATIVFFSFYLKISDKIDALSLELKTVEIEGNILERQKQELTLEVKKLKKEFSSIQPINDSDLRASIVLHEFNKLLTVLRTNRDFRDYYEFYLRHQDELSPYNKRTQALSDKSTDLNKLADSLSFKTSVQHETTKIISRGFYHLVVLSIIYVLAVIQGGNLAIKGYDNWNNKVQKFLDEKLIYELEELREVKQKRNQSEPY